MNMSDSEGDIDRLINTVRLAKRKYGRISMVVVDTLARVMVGNENAAEDMNALIQNCDRLRHVTNAHVMIIHHSGKAKEAEREAAQLSGLRQIQRSRLTRLIMFRRQ